MALTNKELLMIQKFNYVSSSVFTNLLTLAFFNQSDEVSLDTVRKALAVADKARTKVRQRDGRTRSKPITNIISALRNRLIVLDKMQASLDAGTLSNDFPSIRSYEEFVEANREPIDDEVKVVIKPKYGVTLHKDGKIIILISDFEARSRKLRSKVAKQLADAQALVAFTEFASEALVDVFTEYKIEDGLEVKYVVSEDGLSVYKVL